MDWETPSSRSPSGRGRTWGAVVLLAGVVVVWWAVGGELPEPDGAGLPDDAGLPDGGQLVVEDPVDPAAMPPGAPTPPSLPGTEGLAVGADQALPIVEGIWRSARVPVRPHPDQPSLRPLPAVWDGRRAVVIARQPVLAYDPSTGRWSDLPPYPGDVRGPGQVVAFGRSIVALEGNRFEPWSSWMLGRNGWLRLLDTPQEARLLGAAGGGVIAARDGPGPPRLWRLDLFARRWEPLDAPSLAGPATAVVDTPGGMAVLTPRTAVLQTPAGERTDLPDPPVAVTDSHAIRWIPGADGAAGELVAAGMHREGGGVAIARLPDGGSAWTVEHIASLRGLADRPSLAVAWDGADTLWVHGGRQIAVFLAHNLVDGTTRAGLPTTPRPGAELVWLDGELLYVGGAAQTVQDARVDRWTPVSGADGA